MTSPNDQDPPDYVTGDTDEQETAQIRLRRPKSFNLNKALGLEFKATRNKLGCSLQKLADHLQMSKGNLSRLENGHVKFTVETALAYAAALGFRELSLKTGLVDESGDAIDN